MAFTISSEKKKPLTPSFGLWWYVTKRCVLGKPISEYDGYRIEWRRIE